VRDGAHAEMVTQHNGHHPEIDVIDDRTATGIWYLSDYVLEFRRQQHIQGTAFYRDTYVKEADGRWRIRRSEFERIWEISETIEKKPNVTYSYLATHGHRLPPGEIAPFKRDD
jgi:SnoaL-like domain